MNPQSALFKALIVLLLLALCLAGGFFAGVSWQRGREAIDERTELIDMAEAYRKQLKDAAQDFRSAADRMGAISTQYQQARSQGESFYADLQSRWTTYWRARPDLARCALDADGVREWNNANRGEFADPAAADQSGPTGAMHPAAVDSERRPSNADGKPHAGDEVAQRLREPPGGSGQRGP